MSPSHSDRGGSLLVRCLIVAATLFATAGYLTAVSYAEHLPPREPLASVPMQLDQWTGHRDPDMTPEVLSVLGVDDYIIRTYTRPRETPINLYIGYHDSQRQGDTIHSPLNCLPGAGWQPLEVGRTVLQVEGAPGTTGVAPIEVNRVVIGKGLDRDLVLYWYQSHRRVVASEYWGKIYTVLDSVRYHRTDAAMVRVITPIEDGVDASVAQAQMVKFIQALFPHLRQHLPS